MSKLTLSLALLVSLPFVNTSNTADSENPGPMDGGNWFYNEQNPYKEANDLQQKKNWAQAEQKYTDLLSKNLGSKYDQNMAEVNRAACQTAQRKVAPGWQKMDDLMGIPKEKQLPQNLSNGKGKTLLVTSKKIGLGDIVHFEEVAGKAQKMGFKVYFAVRGNEKFPFKDRLKGPAKHHGFTLIGENEELPQVDYETTLVGLYGRLNICPEELCPESSLYTVDEAAIDKVYDLANPILNKDSNNKILFLFLGDNRAATLMGDKQLPRDQNAHGRHLNSEPVNELLRKNPELYVVDGGFGNSKFVADEDVKNRVRNIPRDTAFDTFIAAAIVMNKEKRMIGLGADNGPTNIFSRALDREAQERMGIVIPNSEEYDMRMHGDETCPEYQKYAFGERYRQMLSRCLVYKCNAPADQTAMLAQAYAATIKKTQ